MSNLRETYSWIDEYNDKKLTPPPGGLRFIELSFDGEVENTFHCFYFQFQVQYFINKLLNSQFTNRNVKIRQITHNSTPHSHLLGRNVLQLISLM